jgi:16S rRNA (cytosine967-C5)-methyltransferase
LQTLSSFKAGYFEVQDEASQLVAYVADPPPDALVLDACAGAGGKALHLAAVMQNTGKILAHDTHAQKLDELVRRATRAGAKTINVVTQTTALDAYRGRCDLVLVDAPCSSIGTIRRNPDLRLRVTAEAIARYRAAQQEILSHYAAFVRPGGTLLYVTCSFLREENEDRVDAFLTQYPQFKLDPILPVLRSKLPEITALPALQTPEGHLRTDRIEHPWDSFFAARFVLTA